MVDHAILVNNVSKVYRVFDKSSDRFKQIIASTFHSFGLQRNKYFSEYCALDNINFNVKKGESFGIIGKNGAGKSTLLSIIAGTIQPSSGDVKTNGKIAALLELGSGFNPEFTGFENIFLNGSILGFGKKFILSKLDEILSFADIGSFIHQPVRTYSSGMLMRLAFAVQACLEPEILIVDEALSVGDIFFQIKCHERMEKLKQNGTTILFVTHSMGSIEKYCSRVILLHKGKLIFEGGSSEAVGMYYNIDLLLKDGVSSAINSKQYSLNSENNIESEINEDDKFQDGFFSGDTLSIRYGKENLVKCLRVGSFNRYNQAVKTFNWNDTFYLVAEFSILNLFNGIPIFGVSLLDSRNVLIYSKNCIMHGIRNTKEPVSGNLIRLITEIPLNISEGEYVVTVGISKIALNCYKKIDNLSFEEIGNESENIISYNCFSISVINKNIGMPRFFGYCNLDSKMKIEFN